MRTKSEEKREFWRAAIELHKESGLTVAAFCEREGLRSPTFFAWRKKLRAEDELGWGSRNSSSKSSGSESPQDFMELHVVDDLSPGTMEIVATSGLTIRLREQASEATLRQVLRALSAN